MRCFSREPPSKGTCSPDTFAGAYGARRAVRRRTSRTQGRRLRRAGAAQPQVAEVRSLAVDPSARSSASAPCWLRSSGPGAARGFRQAVRLHARAGVFPFKWAFRSCPHLWSPEKIFTDCFKCAEFAAADSTRWCFLLETVLEPGERDGRSRRASRHDRSAAFRSSRRCRRRDHPGRLRRPRQRPASSKGLDPSHFSSPTCPPPRVAVFTTNRAQARRSWFRANTWRATGGSVARAVIVNSGLCATPLYRRCRTCRRE